MNVPFNSLLRVALVGQEQCLNRRRPVGSCELANDFSFDEVRALPQIEEQTERLDACLQSHS